MTETAALSREPAGHQGLTEREALALQAQYGPNELPGEGKLAVWRILLRQFSSLMVAILTVAALTSALLGDVTDSAVILAILALNVLLGFLQEYRAERAVSRLRQLSVPTVRVRRDGQVREIPSSRLVPGDVYLFDAGNVLPADGRLLSGTGVLIDESILTGEAEAVPKLPGQSGGASQTFAGTRVLKGKGVVVAGAIGASTALGKIAILVKSAAPTQTPLQKQLNRMSSRLALYVGLTVLLYFVIGLVAGVGWKLMFVTSVSMAVAALPEGLPAVVTIILAAAGQRMLKRNVLVRRLTAIEALGSVTIICSDKTGTLTENHMTLDEVWTAAQSRSATESKRFLLACGVLCNDAEVREPGGHAEGKWLGDPLDIALCEAAAAEGIHKETLGQLLPRVADFPFDSERKAMTTAHRMDEQSSAALHWPLPQRMFVSPPSMLEITKGAPESLYAICDFVLTSDGVAALDPATQQKITSTVEILGRSGLRVVAIAFRELPLHPPLVSPSQSGLIFAGLLGFHDPPRKDSAPALAACSQAGLRVMMLTGDHPVTARAVAAKLGFAQSSASLNEDAVTGAELSRLSAVELDETLKHHSIFARLDPEQKLSIVKALQRQGEIVAVTGDGVNDAPCLKTADLGIAMGEGGTDVARESAAIVLRDNSFASIVAAIREGRVIFANIQRFVRYLFISNFGELTVMIVAPLFGMPMPLSPLQILWINLITDGLPALALGVAPPERDVMTQPPRAARQGIVDSAMAGSILHHGLLLGGVSLAGGLLCRSLWPSHWQTVIFQILALSQLLLALGLHSDTAPLLSANTLTNRPVMSAVVLCTALQFAATQWNPLRSAIHAASLSPPEIGFCIGFSAVPLLSIEFAKWTRNAFSRSHPDDLARA